MAEIRIFAGVRWLFLLALFQKALTFIMNQYLIASVGPSIFGQVAIQLELVLSTFLFLSREGIRISAMRESIVSDYDRNILVTLSWIPSVAISITIIVMMLSKSWSFPHYDVSVILLYSLGALIESLSEPFFNYFQNSSYLLPKMRAELFGILTKTIVTIISVSFLRIGILGFGYAQISYGLAYLITMVCFVPHASKKSQSEKPLTLSDFQPDFARLFMNIFSSKLSLSQQRMISTAYTAFLSCVLKHLLTEADKITLTLFATYSDQGLYAIACNYGSIVARIIFLPIEDMSRLSFSKLAAEYSTLLSQPATGKEGTDSINKQAAIVLRALQSQLVKLLAFQCAISIVFPVIGVQYMDVFVRFALGGKWQRAQTVQALQTYCIYIFFLALNGVSEAFVQAVTPHGSFRRLNVGLFLSTAVFVSVAAGTMRQFGTNGVIVANICSMACRIVWNGVWINLLFREPWRLLTDEQRDGFGQTDRVIEAAPSFYGLLVPPLRSFLTLLVAGVACFSSNVLFYERSDRRIGDALRHVAVGAAAGLIVLTAYFKDLSTEDRNYLLSLIKRRSRSIQNEEKED